MFSPLSGRAIVAKNVQVTVSMGYKSCIWYVASEGVIITCDRV